MFAEQERIKRWQSHDFYAILGIAPSATAAEVKKGFRKVALTCHPDKVPIEERERATRQFQLIAEAYEVLSDRTTRAKYDNARPRGAKASTPKFRDQFQPNYSPNYSGGYKQQSSAPTPGWQSSAPKANQQNTWKMPGNSAQDGVYHRCAGCDNRHLLRDLTKCGMCENPYAAGLLCKNCDMCAGCLPDDINYRGARQAPRAGQAQPTPKRSDPSRQDGQRRQEQEQRTSWRARPLHEDLTEFWERVDRPSRPDPDDSHQSHAKTKSHPSSAGKSQNDPSARRSQAERNVPRNQPEPKRREQTDPPRHHGQSQSPTAPPKPAAQNARHHESRDACRDEDGDLIEPLDKLDILMAMGFEEAQCKEALERCSSVEAAVEYIMMNKDSGLMTRYIRPAANALHRAVEPATPYIEPAANVVYDNVVQPVGKGVYVAADNVRNSETANRVTQAVQPAARGIYGMVEQVGSNLYGVAAQAMRGSGNEESGEQVADVASTLVSLGFTDKQAKAAASRCSSVEAAIDWLSANPELVR